MASGTIIKPPFDIFTFPQGHLSNVELNNMKSSGVFLIQGGASHSPSGNYGVLIVLKTDNNITKQIWWADSSNTIYTRIYYANDGWHHWFSLNITDSGS